MLSSVLNSKTAIEINRSIMRAFVSIRQALTQPTDKVSQLQSELKELKAYFEEVFADYNDVNEDTRLQIELINQSVAELHSERKKVTKPRRPVGFVVQNNATTDEANDL